MTKRESGALINNQKNLEQFIKANLMNRIEQMQNNLQSGKRPSKSHQ